MKKKLTLEQSRPIIFHVDGLLDNVAELMTAQKINREQMLIVDNALRIIRYALEIEF